MPSNDAIYLYSAISNAYSDYLQENMIDVDMLPLESKPNLHAYVRRLCTISHPFSNTTTYVEVVDADTMIITFESSFRNLLKVAEVHLSADHYPVLNLFIHGYTPVVRSFKPLLSSRAYKTEFPILLNKFSNIYENFRTDFSKVTKENLHEYLK